MTRDDGIQWLLLAADVLAKMGLSTKAYEAERAALMLCAGPRASVVADYARRVLPSGRRGRISLVLAGRQGARALAFIVAVLRAVADCIELTRYERRTLARAAGRGRRAKRIPSALPRKTVETYRIIEAFVERRLAVALVVGP